MVTRRAFAIVGLLTASCAQVIGIEEAQIDPTLSQAPKADGGPGAGGASSSTGSAGTAGVTGTGGSGGQSTDAPGPGADAASPDASDGGSSVCRQYCDDIMAYCTGNIKQYVDDAQCLKVCALFPEGTVGGSDGNNASCRMKYAGKARYAAGSERDAYCRKAGPGSDGTCGSICDGFCTLMMKTCTPSKTPPYFYASADACLTECRNLRDRPPYTVADGTLPDTNDAQCRLFHSNSAVMDPEEHCEHAMGVTMCDSKSDAAIDR